MALKIIWIKKALNDLETTVKFITKDKPEAAKKFIKSLQTKVESLGEHPYSGRVGVLADTREFVLHKHYLVTYRVLADKIEVLQIWHTARNNASNTNEN